MELVIVYDIANKKRLRKIAKLMQSFGYRVQKSVFEASLKESQIKKMKNKAIDIMALEEDSLRIYPLLSNARHKQVLIGKSDNILFKEFEIL